MSFKSSVISGVLSTLIAAILTWMFGFWVSVWNFIVETATQAWWAMSYTVSMPVSVLAMQSLFLVYLIYQLRSPANQANPLRATSSSNQLMQKQSQMSKNEVAVLKALAAADCRWLGIDHISSCIQASHLLTEQALERLFVRALLLESKNYIHGSTFRLSSTGRDYAIDQGFVR